MAVPVVEHLHIDKPEHYAIRDLFVTVQGLKDE